MEESLNCKSNSEFKVVSNSDKFLKLFRELEGCNEEEQKQKIEEMNGTMEEMNEEEFLSIFTKELFNRIAQMIEVGKLRLENVSVLLKSMGHRKTFTLVEKGDFDYSLLGERFESSINFAKMFVEKNEKLIVDIFECYVMLRCNYFLFSEDVLLAIVPCLLKIAQNKEGSEEVQKEVEMALLALSLIKVDNLKDFDLDLNEVTEIIEYHQEHHNLTRLAYLSVWLFLLNRFQSERNLEEDFMSKLHFEREAARELEELTECVDWNEKARETKRMKGLQIMILKWINGILDFLCCFQLWNDECCVLIRCIVGVCKEAKKNEGEMYRKCINDFRNMASLKNVRIDTLLREGVVDLILEEILSTTLNEGRIGSCLGFFMNISLRLKKKEKDEMEKVKRNTIKMEMHEKMEEEGYEDIVECFKTKFDFYNFCMFSFISANFEDYIVNI
ncbi:uncharacterized protein MONOS_18643 [Monocercomonoides exilis]|uniref:uncharacterized protein n=1 Tax=Monocercomonoides exilis TaxID=2049356 RepID=UPI003559572B|nr:hypothetical protein MONOS_18643 [Monocercomonoides exilis]